MRAVTKIIFYFSCFVCCWVNASETDLCKHVGPKETPVYCISMLQLLSDPIAFDQQNIVVSGFMHLEFEGNALYAYKSDHQNLLFKNAIWLALDNFKKPNFNTRYATIEGKFTVNKKGHFSLFSGSIVEIKAINKRLSRNELKLNSP